MSEPNEAIDRFEVRIEQALDYYSELLLAVHGKQRQAALETMLAEQCAMSLGVLWEAFIHDLLTAHVLKSPSAFRNDLISRLDQSIEGRYGNAVSKYVKFNSPKKPSKSQLTGMIDPKGWNITASSAEDLTKRANQFLPAVEAKKFSLDAEDSAFIDYLIGLRNYLGHRSTASRRIVANAIRAMHGSTKNAALSGQVTSVGGYLKVRVQPDATRAHLIGRRLIEISHTLI